MPRPDRMPRTASEPPSETRASSAWLFVVGLLLAARYLQPTEAVAFGETLWQAQLWLAIAALWGWSLFRDRRLAVRWSVLDLLLWGLMLGHALATVPVFLEGGDRRAAMNVVWEWAGLAATFFIVRQVLGRTEMHRSLAVVAAVMTAIAVLGIWQHHVTQPQMAAAYAALAGEEATLRERIAQDEATSTDRQRLQEVQNELADYGMPSDAAARKRWEDRLRFSSEPNGTFGLANTLGGLLAAVLPFVGVLLYAQLSPGGSTDLAQGRRRISIVLVGLIVGAGFLLYCLLLTKSRTAWVGLLAGSVAVAVLHAFRGRAARRMVAVTAGSVVAAAVLFGIVSAAGGIDRQVLSEAPKSLQYRAEYWAGTLAVLAERPLLGTGPANFRSYYLEHRLPGASEEIAAPHNLFLDVWTAGGLLSLVLLTAFLGVVIFRFLQEGDRAERDRSSWTALETGAAVAFPVVVAIYFLAGSGIDGRLLAIAPVAVLGLFTLIRANTAPAAVVGAGAGFLTLIVHLLGADGIELPAVIQTLLLFAAVIDRPRHAASSPAAVWPVAGFGGLTIACLLTGLVPVLNAGALTARAEEMIRDGDPAAERVLEQAAAADTLATRPPMLLAELATSQAMASGSRADHEVAKRRWNAVLDASPRSLHARERLADLALAGNDASRAHDAADLLSDAVALSPTDAALQARAATAFDAAGDATSAARYAADALRLDDLNRAAGHLDLIFDRATRERLERLATVGPPPSGT